MSSSKSGLKKGSLIAVTDESGTVKERLAYDPWGLRRNTNDWTQTINATINSWGNHYFSRGYTMHEHLDGFALINMNGRVYDPQIARFLSPDPQLQAPGNWLNYNRYAYALNNPLIYTDPDGEFFWFALPLAIKIAVGIGAGIGAYSGYKIGKAHGAKGWSMAGYITGGAVVGGVAGGFSAGAGMAASAGTTGIQAAMSAGMVGGMTAGAINGAGMTALAGGGFNDIMGGMVQGAVIGGFSGLAGGAAFQGMSNLLPKLVPKGLPTRLVFGDFPMHNTISYLAGASASTMTSNIMTGKGVFDNIDNIFKTPTILLPVVADFSSIIPFIPKKIATTYYKNNPKMRVNKSLLFPFARTRLQNNGDLTILSYLTGNNYGRSFWMQESLFIPNYRPLVISLFLNKTYNEK